MDYLNTFFDIGNARTKYHPIKKIRRKVDLRNCTILLHRQTDVNLSTFLTLVLLSPSNTPQLGIVHKPHKLHVDLFWFKIYIHNYWGSLFFVHIKIAYFLKLWRHFWMTPGCFFIIKFIQIKTTNVWINNKKYSTGMQNGVRQMKTL